MNAADVRGRFFLDTNLFVYTFDTTSASKRRVAQQWVHTALVSRRGLIGSQVVQEFLSVAMSRFATPMTGSEARDYLREVLQPLCRHYPSITTFDQALAVREKTGFSWYDALIVAAALETECSWLITEDLDHNRKIGALTIFNPFV